ncbi:MAG: type I restriction endonuclease, partial [Leptospira sp.]|nr:type I restriction endonuclease [Leptospira sp.]
MPRSERETQDRIIDMFTNSQNPSFLGYQNKGSLSGRNQNRNIEKEWLEENLIQRGYSNAQISAAILELETATETTRTTLYQANLRTYQLLRYGIPVQVDLGRSHETVHLIDWDHPAENHFALSEEVTLRGGSERRPDIILYINGIAVVVIELKKSSIEVGDGIRQLITNQEEMFNSWFFSTVQIVLAGNDSQGLRYGTIGTPEQFFVQWKDDGTNGDFQDPLSEGSILDRPIAQLCNKTRLLDLIYNFMIFDAGQKKLPRPHQFQAVKATQARIGKKEGGVIWHTQGSGKSILMVLIAK